MAGQPARRKQLYDWDDYRLWPDDERWELISGEAYNMAPAPGTGHQSVAFALGLEFGRAFDGRKCRVFPAPTDVKLSNQDIVQPDLVVVCDPGKIKPTHIDGPPTLLVEVLSPSTESHDRKRKLPLYAKSGVKEVWIISPSAKLVEVFVLDGASYRLSGTFGKGDKLLSPTFRFMKINLARVFEWATEAGGPLGFVKESSAEYSVRPSRKRVRIRPASVR